MKVKLNKTIRAISLSMGLFLFSATMYAQEAMSIAVEAQEAEPVVSDSVFIDIDAALSIAMNESPTIKIADMEIEKKKYTKKSRCWPI